MPDCSKTSGLPAGAAIVIGGVLACLASPGAAYIDGRAVAADGGFQL